MSADPFIPHLGLFPTDGTAPQRPKDVPTSYLWYPGPGPAGWFKRGATKPWNQEWEGLGK